MEIKKKIDRQTVIGKQRKRVGWRKVKEKEIIDIERNEDKIKQIDVKIGKERVNGNGRK